MMYNGIGYSLCSALVCMGQDICSTAAAGELQTSSCPSLHIYDRKYDSSMPLTERVVKNVQALCFPLEWAHEFGCHVQVFCRCTCRATKLMLYRSHIHQLLLSSKYLIKYNSYLVSCTCCYYLLQYVCITP